MKRFGTHIGEIHQFETLALGKTAIHRLHPFTKLCSALIFIIAVISFGRYDFVRLAPFLFYPVIMTALAEIPYGALMPKLLIALPFCLFAGISNAILDRTTALFLWGLSGKSGYITKMCLSRTISY